MWLLTRTDHEVPVVKQGVLDLSDWNAQKDSILKLDGEWEFYPNQLLTPDTSAQVMSDYPYIHVPGKWDGWKDNQDTAMQGKGYGTYRMTIRNAPFDIWLAIAKQYVRFADKLFIDQVLVGESGQAHTSKKTYTPRNVPYTAYFQVQTKDVEVLLQVSNFDYRDGGIANSLLFGIGKDVQNKKNMQSGLELMGAVILLLFAILCLSLYCWFQRDLLLLLFGLFFVIYAVCVFTNGERLILQYWPELSFEIAFKLRTLSIFMSHALLFMISWKLVHQSRLSRVFLFSYYVLLIYGVGILLFPFRVYSILQDAMYLAATFVYLVLIVYMIIFYVRQRYGVLNKRQYQLYLAAVWTLLLTSINVVLSSENISELLLNHILISLFMICISMVLIHQYVSAYTSMKQMMQELQIADRMKDEFLLITSHELNTPLNGIMNMTKELPSEPLSISSELAMRSKLQMIRKTAFRMSNMVNDIIDAARIKNGKLELDIRGIDLVMIVSVVMEMHGVLAKGKNTQLLHSIAPDARYIYADEGRIMQVMYSVMSYSLRHNKDGLVTIGSEVAGECVTIWIESKSDVRSNRSDIDSVEAEGFAMGLVIAEELVQAMGGALSSKTEDRVDITFPAASPRVMNEIASATEASISMPVESTLSMKRQDRGSATKVLIASADPVDIEYLYGILTSENFEVACASTDEEAYTLVTCIDRPDLVLLDVMLPHSNGYELCRRIRQHFTQVELPILLISARMTSADIEAGIASGGSDFIRRPLDPGEIRIRINTLLSMKCLVKEAAVNEMAFLRSQIKPHFLYNALGTIMSLCYTDGPRAGELLSTFSRYLRIIFHFDNTEETVTLSKEIELIQAYVDIEKARFGDRVQVEFDMDKQLLRCLIMPLTIEPLVENAIRHGISKKLNGGTVRLIIKREDDYVRVDVEDNGVGMTEERVQAIMLSNNKASGVGFHNIRRRLAHQTGRAPVVVSESGVGTKVTIWLPLSYG